MTSNILTNNILADIQKRLVVTKNQKNDFGGYVYRSAEDILEALKPLLSEHDCFLKMTDDIQLIGERYYIKATIVLSHGNNVLQSAQAYAREPAIQKGMSEPQITGSASSYARKYALSGLFAIDNNDDPDTLSPEELISDDQITVLDDLITEVKADKAAFIKFLKVESLENLPVSKYARAVTALEGKRK